MQAVLHCCRQLPSGPPVVVGGGGRRGAGMEQLPLWRTCCGRFLSQHFCSNSVPGPRSAAREANSVPAESPGPESTVLGRGLRYQGEEAEIGTVCF